MRITYYLLYTLAVVIKACLHYNPWIVPFCPLLLLREEVLWQKEVIAREKAWLKNCLFILKSTKKDKYEFTSRFNHWDGTDNSSHMRSKRMYDTLHWYNMKYSDACAAVNLQQSRIYISQKQLSNLKDSFKFSILWQSTDELEHTS